MWQDKCIVVGITGSIAAYKAIDLVSQLKKKGAQVYCVLTEAAQKFVTPLTLRTLSQNEVITNMFAEMAEWQVPHIGLAAQADLVLVVPATANIMGKVAHGLADDFLSTMIMATKAPVLFAPAMNQQMYRNPLVQENINYLKERHYFFAGPGKGDLACGTQGAGRLIALEHILAKAEELLCPEKPLRGVKVLVTAGPTREPLDPVRFLSNHSTGKMGYAVAKQAHLLGAEVLLISGPTTLQPFPGIQRIMAETAAAMYEAVLEQAPHFAVIIKTAAVADYRPREQSPVKIKKTAEDWVLTLSRNPDILGELGQHKQGQVLVGFAAETENLLSNATAKLKGKNLDLVVANDLTQEGAGFAAETNVVSLVFADGRVQELPQMGKDEVAVHLLREIIKLRAIKE